MSLSLGYATSEVASLVGGADLVNISVSFRSAAVCLSPYFASGLVGVGLRREWVIPTNECIATSLEDSIGKVSVSGENT